MRELLIIQPYVPQYRVPFFDGLRSSLLEHEIRMSVVAGHPHGAQKLRRDTASAAWLTQSDDWSRTIRGATVTSVAWTSDFSTFDAVIASAAGTSVDAYRALFGHGRRRRKVGLWGHIGSYVSPGNAIDMRLERWQMAHADRVFAYTPGGAQAAERAGISREKITTVMNSVDVSDLAHGDIDESFVSTHRLEGKRVFAFWGGLDESKRVSFLAEALDFIWAADPSVHLVVGGRGNQEALLDPAVARGQVTMLGFVDSSTKRSIAAVARAVLMPGRIGLIAVETLALGLPVISTDWPYHAPEREYLIEGDSLHTTHDDAELYSLRVTNWKDERSDGWTYPTLGQMIANFSSGVTDMLEES